MKPNMNRKGLYALVCALMGLTFGMLTSCSDDLDVQQSYPFYGAQNETYIED